MDYWGDERAADTGLPTAVYVNIARSLLFPLNGTVFINDSLSTTAGDIDLGPELGLVLGTFDGANESSADGADMDRPYCGEFFYKVHQVYMPIHGYLSLLVCVFGIFANLLNIVVLTRREMHSPTNAILTGLAVADLLVMIDYIPYTIHNYVKSNQSKEDMFSRQWSIFTLFHAHFSVVCHSISTWLTVILAIWRYTSVSFPTESKIWCSMSKAKWTITITYLLVPLICLPVYLSFTIIRREDEGNNSTTILYTVNWSDIALQNDELLKKINFWVFSVGTKLVPCILLTYLSLALIRVLVEAEKRKQRLKQNFFPSKAKVGGNGNGHEVKINVSTSPLPSGSVSGSNSTLVNVIQSSANSLKPPAAQKRPRVRPKGQSSGPSSQPSDRTTKMLLAVLLLFLITEFPSGILTLLSGVIGEAFFQNVYHPLGEIIDVLALINSGINFILYCAMSRLFRKTFSKTFLPKTFHSQAILENEYTCNGEKTYGCRVTTTCTQPTFLTGTVAVTDGSTTPSTTHETRL